MACKNVGSCIKSEKEMESWLRNPTKPKPEKKAEPAKKSE